MLISISGPPGIGKTTVIKKLVEYMQKKDVKLEGFFTEEVRDSQGCRIGFDIVTLKANRGVFARKRGIQSPHRVGSYSVDIVKFEKLVLPLLNTPEKIMIIDEIGKMELFSEKFKNYVANLVDNPDKTIVATVPMKSNNEFIENLKKKSAKVLYVDQVNRNHILEELITLIHL